MPISGDFDGALREVTAWLEEFRSLAARSTPFLTLCLSGYAQLAFAKGDPDRVALLEGAAEDLRGRRPTGMAASAASGGRSGSPGPPQARPGQFDQAFSTGSGLTQRDAVGIVQDRRSSGTQAH